MIEVDALTQRYGDLVALDGVTFRVPRACVLGFVGPNGAGKTTTMKILTGFLAPTAGTARVAGHEVGRDSLAVRRHVGYLPENAPLYPEMRVGDYLAFVAGVRGLPRDRRRAALERAIGACNLGDVVRRPIGHLSKGYRQRVGLAQAILHDPAVLVLDEPTSGLDPNQLGDVRALIRRLGTEKTVIFSSHILQEVAAVATRVLVIHRGRIVADDAPGELQARMEGRTRLRALVAGASPEQVESTLRDLPGVTAVSTTWTAEGVAVTLDTAPAVDLRPVLFRTSVAAGWTLLELHRETTDLEAVFQHLTRSAA